MFGTNSEAKQNDFVESIKTGDESAVSKLFNDADEIKNIEKSLLQHFGDEQWSALHYAISANLPKVADLILAKSFKSIKLVSKDGNTAFHLAVALNKPQVLEVLLKEQHNTEPAEEKDDKEEDANEAGESEEVDDSKKKGMPAKDEKQAAKDRESNKKLIEKVVNSRNGSGVTPLILAVRLGRVELIEQLVQSGIVDVQGTDKDNYTAYDNVLVDNHMQLDVKKNLMDLLQKQNQDDSESTTASASNDESPAQEKEAKKDAKPEQKKSIKSEEPKEKDSANKSEDKEDEEEEKKDSEDDKDGEDAKEKTGAKSENKDKEGEEKEQDKSGDLLDATEKEKAQVGQEESVEMPIL